MKGKQHGIGRLHNSNGGVRFRWFWIGLVCWCVAVLASPRIIVNAATLIRANQLNLTDVYTFTNGGTYTNTQMFSYLSTILNSCSPTNIVATPGNLFTNDATMGCNNVPASATIVGANGIAGYTSNASTTTNAVGGYFVAKAAANGSHNWPINPVCSDQFLGVTYTSVVCLNEIDQGITSTTTTGNGLIFTGVATVSNHNFSAIQVQPGIGAFTPWWIGMQCNSGATGSGVCLNILQAATGASQFSQQINFASTNGGSVAQAANLTLDPNGNFDIRPGAFTFAFNSNGSFAAPGAISAVGQISSTLATGTAPLSIASTTPVTNLVVAGHPRASSCVSLVNNGTCPAFTPVTAGAIVFGDVALVTGASTVNGLPFTSSSTFRCTAVDATSAAAVKVVHTSGSVITITGTASDVISFVCGGS